MKNLFIPYELALIAKEKGFNEPCIAMFLENKELYSLNNPTSDFSTVTNEGKKYNIAAPLYQQLLDWFKRQGIYISSKNPITETYEILNKEGEVLKRNMPTIDWTIEEAFKLIP